MLIVTLVHWSIPESVRGAWLIFITGVFIGLLDILSLGIISLLTFSVYYLAGRHDHISGKRLCGIIALVAGILSFYKFKASMAGYTIDTANDFEQSYLIPLGLSYYTFRCIHYAIEKYKHAIPAHHFYPFAQYMFFLPTIIIGPIHRFKEFERDLKRKRWNPYMTAEGLERILYGYVKISFIANLLVNFLFVAYINEVMPDNKAFGSYLHMIQIGLNLYFLFSGYSDIAIGFGLLLGVRVMENFNWPFLARNISDFWRRWHISLTSWCRDYVYMGTVSTARSTALAAVAAMLVMGLWHEFSVRYVVWGIYQGLGIIIWQVFQNFKVYLPSLQPTNATNKLLLMVIQVLSTLLTLHYVLVGFMIVRHDSLEQAFNFIKTIFLFWI
jgi:alginate O-acetyltransferase complex protein AlgI